MDAFLVFGLLGAILWAFVASRMAPARGRDATTWAIVCFLLGLFGIAALAIAGKTDQKKIDDAVALTTAVEAAKAQRIEEAVAVVKAVEAARVQPGAAA
jgi:hypothetical protein